MLTHFPGEAEAETAMDMDSWASKIHSSKHFPSHLSSGNRLMLDDSEVKDDARAYLLACPFCYIEIELSTLCDHLQGEHCFDVKDAVCPVCALNLGKDVVGHFKTHHLSSIKTRRRSQMSGFWNFYAGRMIGGLNSKGSTENVNASSPDPLLSPFFFGIPHPEARDDQSQDLCSIDDFSSIPEKESSSKSSILKRSEENEDLEELRQRAAFCQELFFSTIV